MQNIATLFKNHSNLLIIKHIRESKNLTQDEVVNRLPFSKRSYLAYENGDTEPTISKLQDIANALDVSIFSLFKTEKNVKQEKSPLEQGDLPENLINEDEASYIKGAYNEGVPFYDLDFTASFLEVANDQSSNPDHYVSHPFFMGCDFIVRASGQSMAKVIKHGDAIGLIKIDSWMDFIPMGEIYAIVTKNGFRMIKIITKGEDEKHYTLVSKPSDSKKDEFPPQQLPKKNILSIFKVQASSHLF